jgi:alkyl hydroperoxide reductase subunit AhpC
LLQAGDIAPDFKIPVLIGGVRKGFRLAEHRGKRNLVLAFYPANWDPVSTQQLVNYQVEREQFQARETEVLGISVDSIMNTTSWEREIGPFDFWLASDFWPHGEVSHRYGILRETDPLTGASERAVFVVDKSGKIRFAKTYPLDYLPDLEETLVALRELAIT